MENSTLSEEKQATEDLVVTLEVDQENLVKMLKVLTDAGVSFKLKNIGAKQEPPVYVPTFYLYPPASTPIYPYPTTTAPMVTWQFVTSGTAEGYPEGTQSTYTGPKSSLVSKIHADECDEPPSKKRNKNRNVEDEDW